MIGWEYIGLWCFVWGSLIIVFAHWVGERRWRCIYVVCETDIDEDLLNLDGALLLTCCVLLTLSSSASAR